MISYPHNLTIYLRKERIENPRKYLSVSFLKAPKEHVVSFFIWNNLLSCLGQLASWAPEEPFALKLEEMSLD